MQKNVIVHKVKKNETLLSIAKQYNSTVQKIQKLNLIEETKEGERLLVPKLCGKQYSVRPFDTIQSIAKKYRINPKLILQYNDINNIFIGQVLIIPYVQENHKEANY